VRAVRRFCVARLGRLHENILLLDVRRRNGTAWQHLLLAFDDDREIETAAVRRGSSAQLSETLRYDMSVR
jgi:hypothetical protein